MVQTDLEGPRTTAAGTDLRRTVGAAADGDREAWNALVDRYGSLLWAIARAHRLGASDAADIVQTTWLRLVEHLPRLITPEALGGWLATTARRECLRTLRNGARCQPHADVPEAATTAQDAESDAALLRAERDALLWKAFVRLPNRDQALLRLLTADPAPSYEEVGTALGMPIGSIGPTRGRALERLRREVEQLGLTASPA